MKRFPLCPRITAFMFSFLLPIPAWAYGAGGGGMMDDHWGWGWGGAFLGPLSMIAVPVLFVIAIVYLVRGLSGGGRGTGARDLREPSAMDILNARFAKGEIDAEEYKERKRVLSE